MMFRLPRDRKIGFTSHQN